MYQKKLISVLCLLLVMIIGIQLDAQIRPPFNKNKNKKLPKKNIPTKADDKTIVQEEQDTSDVIILKYADEVENFTTEIESIRFLKGNVVFYQNDAYFYCDSAYLYDAQNAVHAWGKVTIIQSDTIEMFSDTLKYFGETKDAYMIGNVVLKDTARQIFTDRLDYNMETKVATYETGGLLRNGDSQLTSTYGTYNTNTDLAFFRDSVVVINDKFTLRADSLEYDTDKRKSTFIGPTLILQDSAKIYCESGFYDYYENNAEFNKNPQYISGEKIAVSDKMSYNGDTKVITLTGNAKFKEGDKNAHSDKMIYNEKDDITRLEGNAYFRDDEQEVTADVIVYDGKNESYSTEGKTISQGKGSYIEANNSVYDKATNTTTLLGDVLVADSTQILNADTVKFNNETEDAYAKGNVHWQDTINDVSIKSNELFYNKETEYVKALGRPLMTTVMDGDTLFLSADTLISQKIVLDSIDTIQQLLAYKDVRMFKSDFQAVCDSLNYNMTDSIFNFYDKPIIWSDSSQFSADMIKTMMKNQEIDSIFLLGKALIIDTPDEVFFNQIKGKQILINFADGNPKKMTVNGNGESVFYVQDDEGAYVGPNKTACSDMILDFNEGELEFIHFLVEVKGGLYPMKTANHAEMKLPGFKWEAKRRPMSAADLDSPFFLLPNGERPAPRVKEVDEPKEEVEEIINKTPLEKTTGNETKTTPPKSKPK
jgi:lipopolysaccharide export system protein LptA